MRRLFQNRDTTSHAVHRNGSTQFAPTARASVGTSDRVRVPVVPRRDETAKSVKKVAPTGQATNEFPGDFDLGQAIERPINNRFVRCHLAVSAVSSAAPSGIDVVAEKRAAKRRTKRPRPRPPHLRSTTCRKIHRRAMVNVERQTSGAVAILAQTPRVTRHGKNHREPE
jgi:hypothetical protein